MIREFSFDRGWKLKLGEIQQQDQEYWMSYVNNEWVINELLQMKIVKNCKQATTICSRSCINIPINM